MEDTRPSLASALASRGMEVSRWWRRAWGGRPASSWPSTDPLGTAALRLPPAKDELEMLVHAGAALLAPGGRLLVYGANDEGAGSAGRRIGSVFETVRSVASGRRCRVLLAERPQRGRVRGSLEHWCESFDPGLPELPERWASFPGVFAHGRLDGGTALLLDRLPDVEPGARVLDFGCGHGIVGAVVAARTPEAAVDYLDVDTLALEAVRRNVPDARVVLSDGWRAAPPGPWDVIASNPPYHVGKAQSLRALEELVLGGSKRLSSRGWLALVTQRRLNAGDMMGARFRRVDVLGDQGPWRAWLGEGPVSVTR